MNGTMVHVAYLKKALRIAAYAYLEFVHQDTITDKLVQERVALRMKAARQPATKKVPRSQHMAANEDYDKAFGKGDMVYPTPGPVR